MKKWLAVLVMVMVLLSSQVQAKDWGDDCDQDDWCWKGEGWWIPLTIGIVSVDVTCEDGSPRAEQLVQIKRDFLGFEKEKITSDKGNVKFLVTWGKYIVTVDGDEQTVVVPGLFVTKHLNFGEICYTTTTTMLPIITVTTTTTLPVTTIPTTSTSIIGVPHTTTIYHPGKDDGRPTTTTAPVTSSVPVETTTVPIETTTVEPTTSTTIEIVTTTTSIKECRTTTTTKKCDEHER